MSDHISHMDYQQYRATRRLVHECCNYEGGNCLALDNGDPCVCVQSISRSVLCKWFRAAVLPLDAALYAALFPRRSAKRCIECKVLFVPGSNRAKYCPDCAKRMKRLRAAERKRKQRQICHALEAKKSLKINTFFGGVNRGAGILVFRDPKTALSAAQTRPKT